ncbi:MAG: class I SAM-dependent methyltransferase [Anaerolineae bacterium]|nr:class I SAM-dependent methyltransferase [Anaerolineae bacterium]
MSLTDAQKTFFSNPYSDFWPFMAQFDFKRESIFHQMEQQYREYGIHSIGPWFGRLLNFLVRFGQAQTVLEFGTATGYSAIWLAKGLPAGGMLTTIEWDSSVLSLARQNMAQAEVQEKVTIQPGDAADVVKKLNQPFDLIFVDCAHFVALECSERLLRSGGLFVCDNVGFRGHEDFNQALTTCPYLETLYL